MLARNTTSAPLETSDSFGSNPLEDVQLRIERLAVVEVPAVLAGPEERLAAGHVLDVVGVDAARAQHGVLVLAEVVADGTDDVDGVEERRSQREVDRRTAEHLLPGAERGLDRVERDRAYDRDRHEAGKASGAAVQAVSAKRTVELRGPSTQSIRLSLRSKRMRTSRPPDDRLAIWNSSQTCDISERPNPRPGL